MLQEGKKEGFRNNTRYFIRLLICFCKNKYPLSLPVTADWVYSVRVQYRLSVYSIQHVQKWRQKWVDGRDMRFSRQRKLTLQPKINANNPQQLYKTVKSLLYFSLTFSWRSFYGITSCRKSLLWTVFFSKVYPTDEVQFYANITPYTGKMLFDSASIKLTFSQFKPNSWVDLNATRKSSFLDIMSCRIFG